MMSNVIMMCGVCGSGKTTYAKQKEKHGYVRLSIDEEMWKTYGRKGIDYPDSRYEELSDKVEVMLREKLIGLIKDGKNVVIDFSFWSRENRDFYRVIIPGGEREKKYNEWQADKNSTTWKTQIRKDINAAIKSSSTYEEFLLLMRAKGYEIKGETFREDALKFISFRPLGKDRFVRGSIKSLGKEYTKKRIKERIELKRERKAVIPKRDYADRRLIDTSDEKFQNSLGLQRWAAVENLKIAARAYNEVGSIAELEQKISTASATGKEAKQTVRKLENRIKDLAEIIKYAEQYKANKSYHIAYKKSKNPDAYFRKHESQIILYGGARRMLEQAGISLKGLNIDKLKSEYQALTTQKKELTATYKNSEKELKSLNRKLENLNQYLGRAEPPKKAQEQPDRDNKPSR